jgi:hypothetical protein
MVRQCGTELKYFPFKTNDLSFGMKKNDLSSHFITLGGERRLLVPMHDRSRKTLYVRMSLSRKDKEKSLGKNNQK